MVVPAIIKVGDNIMMTLRLILAVLSTLLEEVAVVAIVLLVLPQFGIHIPLPGLIVLMAVLAAFAVITYRVGSRALKREPVIGLPGMAGSKGKVVNRLAPQGMVRIKDELWEAVSSGGDVEIGEEVVVVGQDALRLVVVKINLDDRG